MRLIDADELKKEVENLVVGGEKGLKDYYKNGSRSDQNSWIGGVYDAWELICNAPTISPFKPMCKAKDEAICEEMTTDGHCNYSKPCPNKEERPHIIDNCDMNVFDPEKYMEGSAE